jgi:hypothetical protein
MPVMARMRVITKIPEITNRTFAICAVALDTPLKPRKPATSEMTER